jgi:hypothetical protein
MPTKRRRRAQDRREAFGWPHRQQLLVGCDFCGNAYGNHDGRPLGRVFDEETAREDWEERRDELVQFWTQDPGVWATTNRRRFGNPAPGGPGTRPWAWWSWDAPADDRQVLGLAPVDEPLKRAMGVSYCRSVLLESEASFLRRHDLFLPGERARVPAAAFEPEAVIWSEMSRHLEAEAEMETT